MTALKTQAIVLRNRRFSESSLVVTLLSRDHGRLDVLAKGCRREKSPLFGHLDLYQKEEVLVLKRPMAGLDLLIEAAFADEHAGLRFLPSAFAAAGFLADLVCEAVLPGENQRELYATLSGAFAILSRLGDAPAHAALAAPSPFTIREKNILVGRTLKLTVLDLMRWLGFGLEVERCVLCGAVPEPAPAPGPAPAPPGAPGAPGGWGLGTRQGGLLCPRCRSRARGNMPVSPAGVASLRDRGKAPENAELALQAGERRRLLRFLVDYCQHALERKLRSGQVLFQMLD